MTVSQHAALNKRASQYFAITFIIGATAYNYFLAVWLVPKLYMSQWWIILIVLATASDWVLALVPETKGIKKTVHVVTAYWSAFLGLVFVGALATNFYITSMQQYIIFVAFILMLATIPIAIMATFFVPKIRQYYLALQVLFMICFFVATLAAAYL